MKTKLFLPCFAGILLGLTGVGHAQTLFNDTFDTAGDANTYGWYYHATNMNTSNTVSGGNLVLSNTGTDPGNASAVWKSFGSTTLSAGQTMRLTVNISGLTTTLNSGLGLTFAFVDSSTAINANGGLLNSTATPRYAYQLQLARGTGVGGTGGTTNSADGISQLYNAGATPVAASQQLSVRENSANGAPDASNPRLAVTASNQTFTTNGTYSQDAVLVWDISNVGGQIKFAGSFTSPNGGATTAFVTSDADLFDHFTFDKLAIGSSYWVGLNDVRISSVELQVVPEPATWGLLGMGLMTIVFLRRRRIA